MQNLIDIFVPENVRETESQHLVATPSRVVRALEELLGGYNEDPAATFKTSFEESSGIVIVKDIHFSSMCSHHILPFFGLCHIAYIPKGQVAGLSKFGRLVDLYAKRMQVQERLTKQIHGTICELLKPKGCMVVMEARHLCMSHRGIKKETAVTVTSEISGAFEDPPARAEALHLMNLSERV